MPISIGAAPFKKCFQSSILDAGVHFRLTKQCEVAQTALRFRKFVTWLQKRLETRIFVVAHKNVYEGAHAHASIEHLVQGSVG